MSSRSARTVKFDSSSSLFVGSQRSASVPIGRNLKADRAVTGSEGIIIMIVIPIHVITAVHVTVPPASEGSVLDRHSARRKRGKCRRLAALCDRGLAVCQVSGRRAGGRPPEPTSRRPRSRTLTDMYAADFWAEPPGCQCKSGPEPQKLRSTGIFEVCKSSTAHRAACAWQDQTRGLMPHSGCSESVGRQTATLLAGKQQPAGGLSHVLHENGSHHSCSTTCCQHEPFRLPSSQ